jgi:hypothetical protein
MIRSLLILLFTVFCLESFAAKSLNTYLKNRVNYKTYFGRCPSKVAGDLTLLLIKEFEKSNSLMSVKEKIIKDNLKEKYFLSSYKIGFDPIDNKLNYILTVQIYS